jgi:hypothetical protein
MAEASKCDRCGKLYEPEKGAVRIEYYVTIRKDTKGAWYSNGYEAELCPPCSKEFLKFIKHGVVRG